MSTQTPLQAQAAKQARGEADRQQRHDDWLMMLSRMPTAVQNKVWANIDQANANLKRVNGTRKKRA